MDWQNCKFKDLKIEIDDPKIGYANKEEFERFLTKIMTDKKNINPTLSKTQRKREMQKNWIFLPELVEESKDTFKKNMLIFGEESIKAFLVYYLAHDIRMQNRIHYLYRQNQAKAFQLAHEDPLQDYWLFSAFSYQMRVNCLMVLGLLDIDAEWLTKELIEVYEPVLFKYCRTTKRIILSDIKVRKERSLNTKTAMIQFRDDRFVLASYYAITRDIPFEFDYQLSGVIDSLLGVIDPAKALSHTEISFCPPVSPFKNKFNAVELADPNDLTALEYLPAEEIQYLRKIENEILDHFNMHYHTPNIKYLLTSMLYLNLFYSQAKINDCLNVQDMPTFLLMSLPKEKIGLCFQNSYTFHETTVLLLIRSYLIARKLYKKRESITDYLDFLNYYYAGAFVKTLLRAYLNDWKYVDTQRMEPLFSMIDDLVEKSNDHQKEYKLLKDQLHEKESDLIKSKKLVDDIKKSNVDLIDKINALNRDFTRNVQSSQIDLEEKYQQETKKLKMDLIKNENALQEYLLLQEYLSRPEDDPYSNVPFDEKIAFLMQKKILFCVGDRHKDFLKSRLKEILPDIQVIRTERKELPNVLDGAFIYVASIGHSFKDKTLRHCRRKGIPFYFYGQANIEQQIDYFYAMLRG